MEIDCGQKTSRRHGSAILALFVVSAAVVAFWLCDARPWPWMDSAVNAGLLKIALWVVPVVFAVAALHRASVGKAISALGLTEQPVPGIAFGVAATVPMGMAALTTGLSHTSTDILLGAAVLGPFAEEVLFRGFLFHELLRRARWPVGWAVLTNALCFGAAHVTALTEPSVWTWFAVFGPALPGANPQVVALGHLVPFALGLDPMQLLMPAAGGAAFAWLVYRTESLWPAIALHGALNFWSLLSHGPGAHMPENADPTSIAQGVSLALAVLLAELQWRRRTAPGPISARHP
jgi:membrane protease YdiL (CAAX protease family)